MRSYKGFNEDMTCIGFQYEEGKTYEMESAELCDHGFHACEYPLDCFSYYPPANSVYHEVELNGVTDEQKEAALNMEPWVVMLAAADYDMGLDTGMYRTLMNCDGKLKAEMSEGIMEIYSLLTKYGYEMEPEEKAMLDGTHELYGEG